MLITFEGIDGVGKTTQIRLFRKYLTGKGFDPAAFRSPGGTGIGEGLRRVLSDMRGHHYPMTSFLIFQADRSYLVDKCLSPLLAEGRTVLCDRFIDSTRAYQKAEGIDQTLIELLENIICDKTKGVYPDLTFLLDGDDDFIQQRFEVQAPTPFKERVRQNYLELAKNEPERFRVIDAHASIEEVSGRINFLFDEWYENKLRAYAGALRPPIPTKPPKKSPLCVCGCTYRANK